MQNTPPGRAGPWATREAAPDCPPDREQMALLPPEPEAGSPGDAVRWSREARTPTLHSETHNCFLSLLMRLLSPRKEVCEAPTFLPSHRHVPSAHPKHSCLLSGLFLPHAQPDSPWEALALHTPGTREAHPASCWLSRGRTQLCLCSAPWTSVTREGQLWLPSPPDVCVAPRMAVLSQNLCISSLGRHIPP